MMKVVRSSPTADNGDTVVKSARKQPRLRKDRKAYSALAIHRRRMTRSAENKNNDLSSSSATVDVKLSDSLTNYFSPSSAKRPKKWPAKLLDGSHSGASINDSISSPKVIKTVVDSGSSDDVIILEDCSKTQPSLEVSNTSKSKTFRSRNSSSKTSSKGSPKPNLCRISSKLSGPPEELGDYLSRIFVPHTSRRDRTKLQTLSHPASHSAASLSSHATSVPNAQLPSKAIEKPVQQRSSRARSKPTGANGVATPAEKRFVVSGKKNAGASAQPGEATESLKSASDPYQSSLSSKSSALEVSNVSPMHRVFPKQSVIDPKRLKFKGNVKRKKPLAGKVPDGLVDYLSRFFTPSGSRRDRAKPLVPDALKPSNSRKAEAMTKSSTFVFRQAKSQAKTSCGSSSPNLAQKSGQKTQTKPSVSTKLVAEPTFTDSQLPNSIRKLDDNNQVPSTICSDSNASVFESHVSPKPSNVVKRTEKRKPEMITLEEEVKLDYLVKSSIAKTPNATIAVKKAQSAPTAANQRRKLVSVRSRKSEEVGKIFSNSYSSSMYGRKAAGGKSAVRKTSNTSSESSTSRRKRNNEAAKLHDYYSAYFTPSGPRRAKPAPGEIFKPVRRTRSQSTKLPPDSQVKETAEPPPVFSEKGGGECSAQVPSPKDDRPASDAFLQKAECSSPSSPPARPFGSPTSAFQPYKKPLVSPEAHSSDSSASVIIIPAATTSQVAINPVLPQPEDADIIPPSPPRRPSSRRNSISPSKRGSTTNAPLGSPPRQTIDELEAELAKLSNDNMAMLANVEDTSANNDVLNSPPRQTIAQLEADLAILSSDQILMIDRTSAAKASQSESRLSVSSPPVAESSRSASRMLTYPKLDPQDVLTPLFDQPQISFSALEILAEAASKEAEAVSSIVRSSVTSVQPETATPTVNQKPERISVSPAPEVRRSRRAAERNANKRLYAEAQALETSSEVEKAKGNQRKRRQSKPKAAKTGESSAAEDDDVDLKDLLANQDITEILTMDNFMKLPEDERRQLAALFPNGQLDIDNNYFKNPIFKEAIVDYASRIGLEWIKKNGDAAFDTLKPLIDQLSRRKLEWFAEDLHKAEVDPEYFA